MTLFMGLRHMGFSEGFISMVKLLYNNLSAVVLIFCRFPVSRSSGQGCPLSPLLFGLSLEPIAQAIWQSEALEPVMIGDTLHSIFLYANDILIFAKNSSKSLPYLLKTFEDFGNLSGYKINWTKSSLLPLIRRIHFPLTFLLSTTLNI